MVAAMKLIRLLAQARPLTKPFAPFQQIPRLFYSSPPSHSNPSPDSNESRKKPSQPINPDSYARLLEGITTYSIVSPPYRRSSIIVPLIQKHANGGKCIVFIERAEDATRLSDPLKEGFPFERLVDKVTQIEWERTLARFRDGQFNILVATDGAFHGLDVLNVDLVIHYKMPTTTDIFVERTSQTGPEGTSILIYSDYERRYLKKIERHAAIKFTELPSIDVKANDSLAVKKNKRKEFSKKAKQECWDKAKDVPGRSRTRWRKDRYDNIVSHPLSSTYGLYSYHIDHIEPFVKSSNSKASNAQILQALVNISKGSNDTPRKIKAWMHTLQLIFDYNSEHHDLVEIALYNDIERSSESANQEGHSSWPSEEINPVSYALLDPAASEDESDVEVDLTETIRKIKANAKAKFDETLVAHVRLGIEKGSSELIVRGTLALPHPVKKDVKVAFFAEGADAEDAKAAGADVVGGLELIEDILRSDKIEFDRCLATPKMMPHVNKISTILNNHGLMPNPNQGSVTEDVTKAVKDAKAGHIKFSMDKNGILHVPIGKMSFREEALRDNVGAFMNALLLAKPAGLEKTDYVNAFHLCSTMGKRYPVSIESLSRTADIQTILQLKCPPLSLQTAKKTMSFSRAVKESAWDKLHKIPFLNACNWRLDDEGNPVALFGGTTTGAISPNYIQIQPNNDFSEKNLRILAYPASQNQPVFKFTDDDLDMLNTIIFRVRGYEELYKSWVSIINQEKKGTHKYSDKRYAIVG